MIDFVPDGMPAGYELEAIVEWHQPYSVSEIKTPDVMVTKGFYVWWSRPNKIPRPLHPPSATFPLEFRTEKAARAAAWNHYLETTTQLLTRRGNQAADQGNQRLAAAWRDYLEKFREDPLNFTIPTRVSVEKAVTQRDIHRG